ncbi:LOW QUALITY PROTEIN: tyrosyl-DNA phosphodiesterase 1-like [Haliotis rubra]|uniref:LOW QUALITY PROTEIN: tyrosyl-DNA phosphodiesterase 1-like n=1 Tax=Haliotis rubra TaxID=36100 RepID=UPI001EE5DC57|nr:LOW QUALITY PROTEIN: tyrosyl-DNA phosphodiesterase 1-like [Haliotis rubra]
MADFLSDEDIARKLQAKFDKEESLRIDSEERDRTLAMAYAKIHSISDSDSDATIDPDDLVRDNSPDLFADEENCSKKDKPSCRSCTDEQIFRHAGSRSVTSLQKRVSKTHEISDSDSDEDVRKKIQVNRDKTSRTLAPSPTLKKRKIEHDQSSAHKKRKSLCDSESMESEKNYSIFSKYKSSPSKNMKTEKSQSLTSKLDSPKTSGLSPSIKKVPSVTHALSESDSDTEMNGVMSASKAKSVLSCSSSPSFKRSSSLTSDKDLLSLDEKPLCKYGKECFRKNPSHVAEFRHSDVDTSNDKTTHISKKLSGVNTKKSGLDIFKENQPLSFYMTKVTGIDAVYNEYGSINIKDILSPSMGNLEASCQFNFMFEVDWIISQYPAEFRKKPLTLVHGEQRGGLATLLAETAPYPNITCCQAKLDIMYGTHHTKMMLLLYDKGLRVVIHTANLIERDWYQKSQGVWVSPVFPKMPADQVTADDKVHGDSATHFKQDLLQYIAAYRAHKLTVWEKHIKAHDMSAAKVHIIGSVPGRHTGDQKSCWGHMKLRRVLQKQGPDASRVKSWPVIGQFSSIGSLGPTAESWVCNEWLQSLSTTRGMSVTSKANMTLVFPSVDNVRVSLEGYPAGTSVPYTMKTAQKQKYIHQHFRQWKSEGRGRSRACPHIKTYVRPSPDSTEISWFLVTSANLSKAAWGAFEKNGSQLMIRSYEIGVLFLPAHFGCETLPATSDAQEAVARSDEVVLPLPYDLPLTPYVKGDVWMMDVPCVRAPDTNGNMWCPPL